MKDDLIKLGFNEWLLTLEIAPYPVIFWDIPKFIQLSYIQKWLREVHNIHIVLEPKSKREYKLYIKQYVNDDSKLAGFPDTTKFKFYEQALEIGLQEALKLIKDEK